MAKKQHRRKPSRRSRSVRRNPHGFYDLSSERQREEFLANPDETGVSTIPATAGPLPKKHGGFRHKLRYRNEISASVGQQIFGSVMGASGAIAGLILGFKLRGALKMSVFEVVMASVVMAVGSFVGIYAIRSYH